jgi:hypothetical protein
MNRKALFAVAVIAAASVGAALAGFGIYIAQAYTVTLFFAVPTAIGFAASCVLRFRGPRPAGDSVAAALLAGVALSSAFLLAGREGLICILLALPVSAPFLIIGGLIGWFTFHRRRAPLVTSGLAVALVGACLAIEPSLHGAPDVKIVEDSVIVHAAPSEVWTAIVALDRMPAPRNWMYRLGLACPERAHIESPRAGGYRVCTLSTGQLVEQIEVWKPEKTLRWHSRSTPPPMRELNPFYDHVDAPHLHGFYDSPRGEFTLERIGPKRTRLTRRTWYSQRLYPSAYWSFLCKIAISQIHRTVLEHVQRTAEGALSI